jgi:hypothetical protein
VPGDGAGIRIQSLFSSLPVRTAAPPERPATAPPLPVKASNSYCAPAARSVADGDGKKYVGDEASAPKSRPAIPQSWLPSSDDSSTTFRHPPVAKAAAGNGTESVTSLRQLLQPSTIAAEAAAAALLRRREAESSLRMEDSSRTADGGRAAASVFDLDRRARRQSLPDVTAPPSRPGVTSESDRSEIQQQKFSLSSSSDKPVNRDRHHHQQQTVKSVACDLSAVNLKTSSSETSPGITVSPDSDTAAVDTAADASKSAAGTSFAAKTVTKSTSPSVTLPLSVNGRPSSRDSGEESESSTLKSAGTSSTTAGSSETSAEHSVSNDSLSRNQSDVSAIEWKDGVQQHQQHRRPAPPPPPTRGTSLPTVPLSPSSTEHRTNGNSLSSAPPAASSSAGRTSASPTSAVTPSKLWSPTTTADVIGAPKNEPTRLNPSQLSMKTTDSTSATVRRGADSSLALDSAHNRDVPSSSVSERNGSTNKQVSSQISSQGTSSKTNGPIAHKTTTIDKTHQKRKAPSPPSSASPRSHTSTLLSTSSDISEPSLDVSSSEISASSTSTSKQQITLSGGGNNAAAAAAVAAPAAKSDGHQPLAPKSRRPAPNVPSISSSSFSLQSSDAVRVADVHRSKTDGGIKGPKGGNCAEVIRESNAAPVTSAPAGNSVVNFIEIAEKARQDYVRRKATAAKIAAAALSEIRKTAAASTEAGAPDVGGGSSTAASAGDGPYTSDSRKPSSTPAISEQSAIGSRHSKSEEAGQQQQLDVASRGMAPLTAEIKKSHAKIVRSKNVANRAKRPASIYSDRSPSSSSGREVIGEPASEEPPNDYYPAVTSSSPTPLQNLPSWLSPPPGFDD